MTTVAPLSGRVTQQHDSLLCNGLGSLFGVFLFLCVTATSTRTPELGLGRQTFRPRRQHTKHNFRSFSSHPSTSLGVFYGETVSCSPQTNPCHPGAKKQ